MFDFWRPYYGHHAVIIFFVLSGYVIAYTVDVKRKNIEYFYLKRLARLWSCLVPALFLGLVLDSIGSLIDPGLYAGRIYQNDSIFIRFIANLFFFQELWFLDVRYLSNGPMWSLGYEFWYYVMFSLLMYVESLKKKYILMLFAVLIIGPKILMYFPLWFAGVLLYRINKKELLNKNAGLNLFLSLIPVFVYFYLSEANIFALADEVSRNILNKLGGYTDYTWSKDFLSDYLVGLLFVLHLLWLYKYAVHKRKGYMIKEVIVKLVTHFSGATLSIYLYHFPLLMFFKALQNADIITYKSVSILALLVILSAYSLSFVTESRKNSYFDFLMKLKNSLSKNKIHNNS